MVGREPKYGFPCSLGSLFWEDYTSQCFYKNYVDAKVFPKLLCDDQCDVTKKDDQQSLRKWMRDLKKCENKGVQ